jgi:hypothetical protein
MLRIYSKKGQIIARHLDDSNAGLDHALLIEDNWLHTATIDPAKWIEALMNGTTQNCDDMMDELNFGPTPNHPIFA